MFVQGSFVQCIFAQRERSDLQFEGVPESSEDTARIAVFMKAERAGVPWWNVDRQDVTRQSHLFCYLYLSKHPLSLGEQLMGVITL